MHGFVGYCFLHHKARCKSGRTILPRGRGADERREKLERIALFASPTDRARAAAAEIAACAQWVPLDEAQAVLVLGGDGFLLDALHQMLDGGRVIPAYGLNLGTVGFLMNRYRSW